MQHFYLKRTAMKLIIAFLVGIFTNLFYLYERNVNSAYFCKMTKVGAGKTRKKFDILQNLEESTKRAMISSLESLSIILTVIKKYNNA